MAVVRRVLSSLTGSVTALAVALLGLSVVRGQAPNYPAANAGAPIATAPGNAPGAPAPAAQQGGANGYSSELNDYLSYLRPTECCGPLGRNGPINYEMFMRAGASFPIGGGILGRALEPGFMFQGGGRVLFFTPQQNLAWTVERAATTRSLGYDFEEPIDRAEVKRLVPSVSDAVIGGIEGASLLADRLGLTGGLWSAARALGGQFNLIGFGVVGLFALCWTLSWVIYRWRRFDDLDIRAAE